MQQLQNIKISWKLACENTGYILCNLHGVYTMICSVTSGLSHELNFMLFKFGVNSFILFEVIDKNVILRA